MTFFTGKSECNQEINFKFNNLFHRFPSLEVCKEDIWQAFLLLKETFMQSGKLLVCGNGGSASDSDHIVGELMKGFKLDRKIPDDIREKIKSMNDGDYISDKLQGGLPAISLVSQTALTSAIGNDIATDMVFAQQVYAYAKPNDCFCGISTSGNAKNVLYAAQVAKAMDMKVIALTGQTGGALQDICDIVIKAPSLITFEIQEYHLPIYHQICMMIEDEFF